MDHTTLFLFPKKKTCAKRKTEITFLVKVFTESKKVVGKAFISALLKQWNSEAVQRKSFS